MSRRPNRLGLRLISDMYPNPGNTDEMPSVVYVARSGQRSRRQGGDDRDSHEQDVRKAYDDWVWWPNQPGRRKRAEEEFLSLPPQVQGELLVRIERFLAGETRYKDVDDLGDGIKELRYRERNNHYRVLFFVAGRVCVGLTCFYKSQQRTEKTDLRRAKSRRSSYRN